MSARRLLSLSLGFLVLVTVPAAQDMEAVFHHAYFLEKERGHAEDALALYQQVAQSRQASAALQQEASRRAAALAEDIASLDLARLVPAETILYAEFVQPGRALSELLEGLDLLGTLEQGLAKGTPAISPELVRGALGLRGAALAVTEVRADGTPPRGVLLLHPGEMKVLRGLIETAVPLGGLPEQPIEGLPTWSFENGTQHVTLARRLVIVSGERELIAGVARRLAGGAGDALASNPAMAGYLARRQGDPFFLCWNAAPMRPLLGKLLEQASQGDPGRRAMVAALDLPSLEGALVRFGVGKEGVVMDAELDLAGNHRNLVFNLLRPAPLDPGTLELVPQGVAAFLAGALNQRGPALAALDQNASGAPAVSAMDIGRELFANLAGYALFVMPGAGPLPEAALVLSSNDAPRTAAVLGLALGFANLTTTGRTLVPEDDEIAGAPTQVYRLPPGLPLYLTTSGNLILLSLSENLIEQSIQGRAAGRSLLHDEVFASEVGNLGKDTTLALCAHLGRLLTAASPYMDAKERAEAMRLAPLFERTVVALRATHGDARLGCSFSLRGLPKVGGLVAGFLKEQRQRANASGPSSGSTSTGGSTVAAGRRDR